MKKLILWAAICAALLCPGAYGEESPWSAREAMDMLLAGNARYMDSRQSGADVSPELRRDTAENGQHPYGVIITCSDSRVPAEHIFGAGIGELFVIRTAGNVIGDYELGSVEYGAEHLGVPLVVVMGHTGCGAVEAALTGGAHGYIQTITDEIASVLPPDCDPRQAEILNVENSMEKIRSSQIMQHLEEGGKTLVTGAIYHIETGEVEFLPLEKEEKADVSQ